MKEFIAKMLMGIIVGMIDPKQIADKLNELKEELLQKVKETPTPWDDMAVEALLSSEDDVLELFILLKGMVDQKVDETETELDDAIWEPLSAKIGEIIDELKAE